MRHALDSSHHEGHQGHEGDTKSPFVSFMVKIFSPENVWAFLLFLIVVALIIFTTDDSPQWIYQGF